MNTPEQGPPNPKPVPKPRPTEVIKGGCRGGKSLGENLNLLSPEELYDRMQEAIQPKIDLALEKIGKLEEELKELREEIIPMIKDIDKVQEKINQNLESIGEIQAKANVSMQSLLVWSRSQSST